MRVASQVIGHTLPIPSQSDKTSPCKPIHAFHFLVHGAYTTTMCVGFFTLTTVACSHFQTLRHEAKQASFSPPPRVMMQAWRPSTQWLIRKTRGTEDYKSDMR